MEDSSRRMKYPYTITAKLAQFPYKYYYTHSWMIKYMCYATLLAIPIFYKIQKMSFSPENVKKWAEIDRKNFEGH